MLTSPAKKIVFTRLSMKFSRTWTFSAWLSVAILLQSSHKLSVFYLWCLICQALFLELQNVGKKKKQFRFLCHTINEVSTPSCKLFKTCQDRMIALLWNCSCACFSYDLKQFLIKAIIAILKKSNQIIYDQFRNFISIRKQKEWLITHLTKMKFHL